MSLIKNYNWEDFDVNWEEEGYHWDHATFIKITASVTVNNITVTQIDEDLNDSHTTIQNFQFIINDNGEIIKPIPEPILSFIINAQNTGNINLHIDNIEII